MVKMTTDYYEYNHAPELSHLQSCCYGGNYGNRTSYYSNGYMASLPDIPESAPVAYYGNFTACWWAGYRPASSAFLPQK